MGSYLCIQSPFISKKGVSPAPRGKFLHVLSSQHSPQRELLFCRLLSTWVCLFLNIVWLELQAMGSIVFGLFNSGLRLWDAYVLFRVAILGSVLLPYDSPLFEFYSWPVLWFMNIWVVFHYLCIRKRTVINILGHVSYTHTFIDVRCVSGSGIAGS